MGRNGSQLTLRLPRDFDLTAAVCSYGYFLLAPNHWDAGRRALVRPLRGRRDRLIGVEVRQRDGQLRIACDRRVDADERAVIKRQVRRMLRLDDELSGWHKLAPAARRRKFGRLFRSPSLFEDIVRTITTCNVTWPNTIRMNARLCQRVGGGGFPTPRQLAAVTPARLKKQCKVGYRAERIIRLARDVESGALDLAGFERDGADSNELFDRLRHIHGIGPYAAANLCQLLGHYDRIAIDTETYRHFCRTHGIRRPKNPARLDRRIVKHYARFAPYQFLAYWFELWGAYEDHVGASSEAWTDDVAGSFTAALLD